jgi:hypothetical protein
MMAIRVHNPRRGILNFKFLQYRFKLTTVEFVLHVIIRKPDDTVSLNSCCNQ